MPDETLTLLQQIREEQITQREQIKTLFKQTTDIKDLSENVHKLATSLELMAQAQKATAEKVEGLTTDVDSIKEKPAKRWDSVITVAITAIATAVITYFLTKLGLK